MIGAVIPQVGIKDESPDLISPSSAPRDRGFNQALERADHRRPGGTPEDGGGSPSQLDRHTARNATRRHDDAPEKREHHPEDQGGPGAVDPAVGAKKDETTAANTAGGEAKTTPSGPGTVRTSFQSVTEPEQLTEADQANPLPDGTVLTPQQISPEVARRAAQAADFSVLGRAAYTLSPHGNGEEAAAAAHGLTLATSTTAARRVDSAQLEVAAQGLPNTALLEQVEQELPPKFRFGHQEYADWAQADPAAEAKAGEPRATSDPGRLALLNAMRQPPPSALPLHTAQAAEAMAELKDQADPGRTSAFDPAKGLPLMAGSGLFSQVSGTAPMGVVTLAKPDGVDATFLEKVSHEVKWLIRNGRNEAAIRMDPEHLGTLRIKVLQQDGLLRIDMTVESQQARAMLESRLNELQNQLERRELGADSFSFNVNVQDNGQDGLQTAARFTKAHPYSVQGGDLQADAEDQLSAAISRPTWGQTGVGIYA